VKISGPELQWPIFSPCQIHNSTSPKPGNYSCCGFLIIHSTLTKYLLHNSKAGRHHESIFLIIWTKALFNNINLSTWINMSKSLALICRGRFFRPVKCTLHIHDIYYSCWQTAAVADFFTLTKYTLQLVESLAKYTIVVGNLRLLNNIPHSDKIPTSQVECRPPSCIKPF